MAELHKNQVAWAAPEQKHVQLAKKQDFLGPAIAQLGEMAENIARAQASIEDNTIESVMKQEQEEALNWLQNQQERNIADYEKHVYGVADRLRSRLSSFSKEAVARFNRNNPAYFDAVTLASNKIVLDKQTEQLTATAKSDMPMIASEAVKMAMASQSKQGSVEAYNYGLEKVQSMVAGLPIEDQTTLLYEYKSQFGRGFLQAAFAEPNPQKLIESVSEVVDNIELTPDLTPAQREYYKQLAGSKAKSIIAEQQRALNSLTDAKGSNLSTVVYSELDGYLAGGQYSLYAQAVDEYRYFGGRIKRDEKGQPILDENGRPVVHSVLGEGGLTKEQLNSVLSKVKEQEGNYYAVQVEKDDAQIAMMLANAALVGALDSGQKSSAAIAEEQLYQMVRSPRIKKLIGTTKEFESARKEVLEREAVAMEAVTPPKTIGPAMYKIDSWYDSSDYLSPIQSASYKIAASTDRAPGSTTNIVGREGTAFYGAGKIMGHEFMGGTDAISIEEFRTIGEPMREWQKKAYGVADSDVEYYGSMLEIVNVMTPILAANPALMSAYGFPQAVSPRIIREAGIAVSRAMIANGTWNDDAVTEETGTDKIKEVFDAIYKKATGQKENPVTAASMPQEYVNQKTFFSNLAVGSYGKAGDTGWVQRLTGINTGPSSKDLKGYNVRPLAKSFEPNENIKKD